MVELFPVPAVPANRVEANGEFSTGRLQASSDHGALSYILDKFNYQKYQTQRGRNTNKKKQQ